MSFEAMAWAVNWDLPVKQKMALMMLANRVSPDTGRCFPSIKRLAEDCGMSETSVKEAIRSLKDAGLVTAHERRIEGVSLTNEYELELGKFPPPRRDTPHPPAQYAPPPRRDTPPKLSLEPINEPVECEEDLFSQEDAPKVNKADAEFEQFWSAFPKRSSPSSKKNTKAKFIAALKHIPFEALLRATKAYAKSREGEDAQFTKGAEPWLNGQFWVAWLPSEDAAPELPDAAAVRRARLLGPQFGEVVR